MKYLLLFPCLLLTFFACENDTSFAYPTIEDQYIAFKIEGQAVRLNGLTGGQTYLHHLQEDEYVLSLHRTDAEGRVTMTITAEVPLREGNGKYAMAVDNYVPARIEVRSSDMSGSIYCPHEEDGNIMFYDALLYLDSAEENGRVRGTFMNDPEKYNAAAITEGVFDLEVTGY